MKLSLLFAALLTGTSSSRMLHRGGGGHGGGRGSYIVSKLQEKVDSQCTEDFDCSLETDCTNIDKPEKPEGGWLNMSDEDKAEMELKKEAFKEQVVFCACCEQKSVGELLGVEVGEDGSYESSSSHDVSGGGYHHGHGGHDGFISKLQQMADSECSTSDIACDQTVDCTNIEKPEKEDHDHSNWMNMSDEDKAAAKAEMQAMKEAFKEKVVYCVCCDGMSIQDLLASNADESGEAASTELAISKALAAVDGSDPSKSNPASGPASLSWAWALAIAVFIGTSMTL
jgi:hypothetical protein